MSFDPKAEARKALAAAAATEPPFDPKAAARAALAAAEPPRPRQAPLVSPRTGRVLTGPEDEAQVEFKPPPRRLSRAEGNIQTFMESVVPGSATRPQFHPPYLGVAVPSRIKNARGETEMRDLRPDPAAARESLAIAQGQRPLETGAVGAAGSALGAVVGLPGRAAAYVQRSVPAATAAGRVVGSMLGGAAGGAGDASLRSVQDPSKTVGQMAADTAAGTAVGAAGGSVAQGAAEGLKKLFRGARQFSPWLDRYVKHKDAGTLPSKADLPDKGDKALQKGAEEGFRRVAVRDQELAREAGARWRGRVDPHRQAPVNRDLLIEDLYESGTKYLDPDTNMPVDDAALAEIQKTIARTGEAPTVDGSLVRRQALKKRAHQNEEPGAKDAYGALRRAVRRASPVVAEADDEFAQGYARPAERRRDILFNTEDNVIQGGDAPRAGAPIEYGDEAAETIIPASDAPELRVQKERAATTLLGRYGDENTPGLRAEKFLKELGDQDPKFREALEYVEAVKARELTRPSLRNVRPVNLRDAELGATMNFLEQNGRALGRVGIDAADKVAGSTAAARAAAASTAPAVQAVSEAARRKREKERKR